MLFEDENGAAPVHVLASDISRAALAKARRAVYGEWSLRGDGADAARPYLPRQGSHHNLDDTIRRRVTFEYLNLAMDVYPSFATGTWGMDLILCRNVLIYLDGQTIRRVAHRLFEALAPGGWLLTAASDPPLADLAPFETVATVAGVVYRRPLAWRPGPTVTAEPAAPPEPDRVSCPLQGSSRTSLHEPLAPDKDPLAEARAAFARGDYVQAEELTRSLLADAAACALHVRALANRATSRAERACAEATARHPLSAELHYLHAVFLFGLGRDEEAARAVRRVLYLDRSSAMAQMTLGSILERRGDLEAARRAYRTARELCAARPAEEVVPLSDGEGAGRLAAAAAERLAILDAPPEALS
jgi:chemotaxis protein methyltransferase CheR